MGCFNMSWIKEFFTAQYNPKTDQIEGCTDNTSIWFHEVRHRQQFKNKIIKAIDFYVGQFSYIVGSTFLFLSMFNTDAMYVVGLAYAPTLIFIGYLEADAFGYQLRMWWINRR